MGERDLFQERQKLMSEDLEKSQLQQREMQDKLRRAQRDRQASPARASSPSFLRGSHAGSIANLSEEARLALLQLDGQAGSPSVRKDSCVSGSSVRTPSSGRASGTPSRRDKPRPPTLPLDAAPQAASPAVSKSPKGNGTDLLERLLVANERATRAETELQMKKAQIDTLTEQAAREASRIQTLESQLQRESTQVKELQAQVPSGNDEDQASRGDRARTEALENQLLEKERELKVYRWRGQSESNALATQEVFMASCFHEIGLKYHKLLTEHELVKRKLRDMEKRGKSKSPRPSPTGSPATTPVRSL